MVTVRDDEWKLDMGDDASDEPMAASLNAEEPNIDLPPLIDDEISAKDLQKELQDGLVSYSKYLQSKKFRTPQLALFVSGKEFVDVDGMKRDLLLAEDEINRLEPLHERLRDQVRSAHDAERGSIDSRHRDAMKTRDGVSYQRSMDTYENNLRRLATEGVADPTKGEYAKTGARLATLRKNRLELLHWIEDGQRLEGYLDVARGRMSENASGQRIERPRSKTWNRVAELFGSWKM